MRLSVGVATVEDVVNTVKFCVKNEVMERVIGRIYSVYTFIMEKNLLRFMLSIRVLPPLLERAHKVMIPV